jgi:hypothetical protein
LQKPASSNDFADYSIPPQYGGDNKRGNDTEPGYENKLHGGKQLPSNQPLLECNNNKQVE